MVACASAAFAAHPPPKDTDVRQQRLRRHTANNKPGSAALHCGAASQRCSRRTGRKGTTICPAVSAARRHASVVQFLPGQYTVGMSLNYELSELFRGLSQIMEIKS